MPECNGSLAEAPANGVGTLVALTAVPAATAVPEAALLVDTDATD